MKTLHIIVKPNSKASSIQEGLDGTLLVSVKEPPLEGRANKAVVVALSEYLKVAKTDIQITRGLKAKYKTVQICGNL